MTATAARRLVLIAASLTTTVMAACTNPVAPSPRTATANAQTDGAYAGSNGKDGTTP